MKVLYLDCFSGISGDMTLGALMDLGIDETLFRRELAKLGALGYRLLIDKKVKNGITGTDVTVILDEEEYHSHGQEHHKGHEHHHEHQHHHEHGHERDVDEHSHHARGLREIEELIDLSDLKQSIKDTSKKIFRVIAAAEAKVHNKDISEVHFHEVGAVDSIVDIVGTAICLDLLGVQRVYSSQLHDGKGFIECQHGIIPVPVPAVMEMLSGSGIPFVQDDIETELITPTGMGIVKCLSAEFGNMPAMIIDRIGYGFGKREIGRLNALRAVLGTTFFENGMMEEIAVLETNIDDMSPEIIGYTSEKLMEKGALDVFHTPIYMKKNRPAVLLTVLCARNKEEELANVLLKETSTLGVRRSLKSRYIMDRKTVSVNTGLGDVRVKVATYGDYSKASPEYEDCRALAEKTGLPLKDIYGLVEESYKKNNSCNS